MSRHEGAVCLTLMTIMLLPSLSGGQNDSRTTTLSSVLHDEDLLALAPWSTSGLDLLCIFSQSGRASMHDEQSVPMRTMTVYRKDGVALAKLFEAKTADWFLSAHPTREDGRFLVIWGAGSAYHIRVYAYLNGSVQEVLDKGSRNMPELSLDDEGRESIFITAPEIVNGSWKSSAGTTAVFKWNGKSFDKIGTLPWAKRFQCVSHESCLSAR